MNLVIEYYSGILIDYSSKCLPSWQILKDIASDVDALLI